MNTNHIRDVQDRVTQLQDELQKDYWAEHQRIMGTAFATAKEQLDHAAAIGKLAEAMLALREARGKLTEALNLVRHY